MNRDSFLAAFKQATVEVEVKALGSSIVRFRELSGTARDVLYSSVKADAGNSSFEAQLIALTVVDEQDEPIFNEHDVDTLRAGGKALLEELAQIAMRLNGIGQQAQENAVKN